MAARDLVRGGANAPSLILAKAEATYGTDPSPTPAADSVFPKSFKIVPAVMTGDRARIRNVYAVPGKVITGLVYDLEAVFPVAGPADAALEPEIVRFLESAGFLSVASGGPPVDTHTINLSSLTEQIGLTVYEYKFEEDGTCLLTEANGVLWHSVTLSLPADAEATWTLKGRGIYNPPAAVAAPAGAVFAHPTDETPPLGNTIEIDSRSDDVSDLSIEWSHKLVEIRDHSTYGFAGFHLDLAGPVVKANPLRVAIGTYAPEPLILAETLTTLAVQINTLGGARYAIAAPALQQGEYTIEEDGVQRRAAVYYPRNDAGDDALSITITRP